MATVTTTHAPYLIPPEPSRFPAILLALMVHGVLLGFLWFGINWQNTEPVAVEAEVWDMDIKQAAMPPEPEPPRPIPPRPEPTPQPAPPPPKPVEQAVTPKTPDIALERLKEKKLQEKRLADEKLEQKREKAIADQKAKELAEKKEKADAVAKELADKKAKDKADKLAKAAAAAAEQKRIDALREKEMLRITGAAGGSGSAVKSTAPRIDTGYVAAITGKIKRSTSYVGDTGVPGNPRAVFKIEQLPTGEIISVRMVKSSGIPAFDDAVERGINNSSPLPKKKDGTVERTLEVSILMKELD